MLGIWADSYLIASGMDRFAAIARPDAATRDYRPDGTGRPAWRRRAPLTGLTRLIERRCRD